MPKHSIFQKIALILLLSIGILSYGGFCENEARRIITGSSDVPQSPSNLIAIASSESLVTLSWTDNSTNEDGFRLERKTGISGTYQALVSLPANITAYSDTTVSEVTLYYYRVIAYNAVGDSIPSNEANVTTPWTITALDTQGNTGGYVSMALDSDNKVYVSYYDYSNSALKYISNASNSWVVSTIDNIGEVGEFTSIAVDHNNKAHISYYDRTNAHLKYATNASGSWQTTTIDSNGQNGFYPSIGVDSNNKVYISYYDNTTSDLKLATNISGVWEISVIDSAGYVGLFSSLAIDQSNKVHISYYDQSNGDLKYATNSSGVWVASTVDNAGNVGFYTDIALDSNGKVHISYADWENRDLKYATNAAGAWQASTIDDNAHDVGNYTSIAVDSKNRPHISYYDSTDKSLKYIAKQDSGEWAGRAVDGDPVNGNKAGEFTSLCLGPNQVHIAYLDVENRDLKYASNSKGDWQIIPAPSGLAASTVSPYQIDLSWTDNSSTEDGFKIERKAEDENDYIEVATVISNTNSYSDTGLVVSTLYYYRVKAYKLADNSIPSNEASARTLYAQPGIPVLLSPPNTSTDISSSPVLTWEPATNTTFYLLQVSPNADFGVRIADLQITQTSYAFSSILLANNTTYYWRVQAKNRGGSGEMPEPFSFTTIIALPAQPVLSLPGQGATDVAINPALQWNPAARADSYRLQLSDSPDFLSTILDQADITATAYAIPTLNNSAVYYWRVSATNIGGTSAWSAIFSFTTVIAPPANAPALSTPSDASTWLSVVPVFSWDAVATAMAYRIQVSTSSDFSGIVVDQGNIVLTSYQGATLSNNLGYYWRVRAVNAGGSGPWSDGWSFTTALANPLQPVIVSPANNSINIPITQTLIWNITNGAATYRLQIATDSDFTSGIIADQSGIIPTSYSPSALGYLTVYYWRINATNITGTGPWSAVGVFTTIIAAPATPALTGPADGIAGQSINPVLYWDTALRASTYNVQVSTDTAFSSLIINPPSIAVTSYQASGLANNTTYYWRVKSVNIGGSSNWSSYRTLTTVVAIPTLSSPANNATLISINPNLTWIDVPGAAVYQVQVVTGTDFSVVPLAFDQSGIANTSKAITGLANYTLYSWRVRASNAGGTSGWSSASKFTTIIAIPAKPILSTPLSGATGVAVSLTLQWSNADRASYYRLQVSTSVSFATTFKDQNYISLALYNLSGLVNNTTYYWRVNSGNDGGTSDWSDTFSFTTIIAAPPVPALIFPANEAVDISPHATLTWNPSSDAVSYGLQVSTTSGFGTTVINQSGIALTSYAVISGLNYNGVYYWRVNATNAGGTSGWSAARRFTVAPQPPVAPILSLPADSATGQWLPPTLQWNTDPNAHTYRLQIATTSNFISPVVDHSGIASNSYQPVGLANNILYYWRVKAVNNGGESDWSSYRRFTTVISTPILVTPTNTALNVVTNLTLEWSLSPGAAKYRVNIATDSGFGNIVINQDNIAVTSYPASLSYGVTYYWRVNAYNGEGTSPWSLIRSFTTLPPPPAQPQLDTPVNGATRISTSPVLKWNASNYASSYELQVVTATDGWLFTPLAFDLAGITNTSKVITVLFNSTEYLWRVNATNISGTSAWSEGSFTTVPPQPDQPTLLTPTNNITGMPLSLTLEWNPVTNMAVTYMLRLATDLSFSNIIVNPSSIATTSYPASGLIHDVTYYWQVKAKADSSTEESDWSSARSFSTIAIPVLASPPNGVFGVGNPPTLVWDQANGAIKYQVQVDNDIGFDSTVIDQDNIAVTSYAASGLSSGAFYYWHVRAKSPYATSDWSTPWNFTTVVALSNPSGGSWAYSKLINVRNPGSSVTDYQIPVTPFADPNFIDNTGLVGSWHFSEGYGATAADMSGNGNNAMICGYASWTDGRFGTGLIFNGTNQYAATSLTTGYQNFTVEAWVKPQAGNNIQEIISKRKYIASSPTDLPFSLTINPEGTQATAFVDSGIVDYSPDLQVISVPFVPGVWHHIVVSYNSSVLTIYVDGVPNSVSGIVTLATNAYAWTFGRASVESGGGSTYYKGSIDEVKIYSRALAASEVTARYNAGTNTGSPYVNNDYKDIRFTNSDMTQEFSYWQESDAKFWVKIPSLPAGNSAIYMTYGNANASSSSNSSSTFIRVVGGVKGSWTFDEAAGTNDLSGQGNHFVLDSTNNIPLALNGKFGWAMNLNGTSQWLNRPAVNLPTGCAATVMAWIYPKAYTGGGIVSYGKRATTGDSIMLSINTIGRPSIETYNNGYTPTSGATATLNQWNHIAATLDEGANVNLYVNGSGLTPGILTTTPTPNIFSQNLSVGCANYPGAYFNGLIDEVLIFNRELSSGEISDIYGNYAYTTSGAPGYAFVRKYSSPEPYARATVDISTESQGSWTVSGGTFTRRVPLRITGAASALTNYPISFSVPYGRDMNIDFNDLRFTASDGVTPLDYWIESTATSFAAVWIKVNSIAVAPAITTIYMYYGNLAAAAASNGNNTFTLFEDFNGASIDAVKWTKTDNGAPPWLSQLSGRVIATGGSYTWPNANGLVSNATISRENLALEFDYKWLGGYDMVFGWRNTGASGLVDLIYGFYNTGAVGGLGDSNDVYEKGTGGVNVMSWAQNQPYKIRMRVKASGGCAYERSADGGQSWALMYTSITATTDSPLRVGLLNYGQAFEVDNLRVRKYSSMVEPVTRMSSNIVNEEQGSWLVGGDTFTRRALVVISGSTSTLTDYPVLVGVPYDSDMQASFNDIRFATSGGTPLSYWIDSNPANPLNVWVKVNSIAASPTGTVIYLYYGNASVSSASNGLNTFGFFDDFELGNLTRWEQSTGAVISSAVKYEKTYGASLYANPGLKQTISAGNNSLEFWFYDDGTTSYKYRYGYNNKAIGVGDGSTYAVYDGANYYNTLISRSVGWHKGRIVVKAAAMDFYVDDIIYTYSVIMTPATVEFCRYSGGGGTGGVDLVRVRKYVSPEPVAFSPGALYGLDTTTNLSATVGSYTQVNLAWQDNSSAEEGFNIERSIDAINWTRIYTATANAVSYTDNTAVADTTYYYRVRSYNYTGNAPWSNQVTTRTSLPAAPTELTVVFIGGTYISLTWTDTAINEAGFKLERSLDGSGWAQVAVITTTPNAYTNAGLKRATLYYYRIRAYNAIGNGGYSDQVSATTGDMNVVWTETFDTTTYKDPVTDADWNTTLGVATLSLVPAQQSLEPPSYNVGVGGTVAGNRFTPTQNVRIISLGAWSDVGSYTGWVRLWDDVGTQLAAVQYTSTSGGAMYYTDLVTPVNLVAGQYYRLVYLKSGSENFRGMSSPPYPYTAGVFSVTGGVTSGSDNTWPAGSSSYAFWVGLKYDTGATKTAQSKKVNSGVTTASKVRLRPTHFISLGTSISYAVTANGGTNWYSITPDEIFNFPVAGSDLRWKAVLITPSLNYLPSIDTLIIESDAAPLINVTTNLTSTVVSGTRIDLAWQDNTSDETSFKIERSLNGINWNPIGTVSANSITYSDTTAVADTTYYYRVSSYNILGYDPWSNVETNRTSVPDVPSNLTAVFISGLSISLTWTDTAINETGFKVERSLNGSSWTEVAVLPNNTTAWTDNGLKRNNTYYYQVRAYNAIGNGGYSAPISPATLDMGIVLTETFSTTAYCNTGATTADWNTSLGIARLAQVQQKLGESLTNNTTGNYTVGNRFTPTQNVTITQLGAYMPAGVTNWLRIWNDGGTLLGSIQVTAGGSNGW
ncbi:MAG: DUF2341 domain-containing protein, partial [Planctomycetota bacterium]